MASGRVLGAHCRWQCLRFHTFCTMSLDKARAEQGDRAALQVESQHSTSEAIPAGESSSHVVRALHIIFDVPSFTKIRVLFCILILAACALIAWYQYAISAMRERDSAAADFKTLSTFFYAAVVNGWLRMEVRNQPVTSLCLLRLSHQNLCTLLLRFPTHFPLFA